MTTLSLAQHLNHSFWKTMLGVLGFTVPAFIAILYGFNSYRTLAEDTASQLKQVHQFELRLNKVHRLMEDAILVASSSPANRPEMDWPGLWQNYYHLEQIIDLPEFAALKPLLIRQEMQHWQLRDIRRLRLNEQASLLYQLVMQPEFNHLFELSTTIVERAKLAGNSGLLGYAADARGYFTKMSTLLVSLVGQRQVGSWLDYHKSHRAFNQALEQLQRAVNAPLQEQVTQLVKRSQQFHLNALTLQAILNQGSYYDTSTRLATSNQLQFAITEQFERVIRASHDRVVALQAQTMTNFWSILGFCLLLIGGCVIYLYQQRASFTYRITHPIQEIVRGGKSIASGDDTTPLPAKTAIQEINVLINAIEKIRSYIKTNKTADEEKMRFQKLLTNIYNLSLEHEDNREFGRRIMDILSREHIAKAAALFIKTSPDKAARPSLIAGLNLHEERERYYQKHFDGLVEKVYRSGEPYTDTLGNQHIFMQSVVYQERLSRLTILPVRYGVDILGVIELLSNEDDRQFNLDFINQMLEKLAILFKSRLESEHTRTLLHETQAQKAMLDKANAELEAQTQSLQQSEAELEMQADELKITNTQLAQQQKDLAKEHQRLETLNNRLKQTSLELQRANEHKSVFLSRVSHELRTPLNSIMVLTQTLMRDSANLSDKQQDSLQVILGSGNDLLTLINDLLDLARIEAGKMKFVFENVAIDTLFNGLHKQFAPVASQKGLKWVVHIDSQAPDSLKTDGARLSQILRNFLSNAFKFTSEGQVTLSVAVIDEGLKFDVSDTGVGISDGDKRRIFDSFEQVETENISQIEGTGLGLAICRHIAGGLMGKISLESTPTKGSTFTLTLPLHPDNQRPEPAPAQVIPSNHKGWIWLGEKDDIYDYIAMNNFLNLPIPVSNIKAVQDYPAHQWTGVALRGDRTDWLMDLDMDDAQAIIMAVRKELQVVVLVEDSLLPELNWLSAAAHHVVRWSEAGKKRLQDIVSKHLQALPSAKTFRKVESVNITKAPTPNDRAEFEQEYNILLVDDDMRGLFSLSVAIKRVGLSTILADSVEMAKLKLSSSPIDLVITDLTMPEEDGYDLLAYMTEHAKLKHVPVIVTSAANFSEQQEKLSALGVKHYLPKPLDVDDLIDTIKSILEPAG